MDGGDGCLMGHALVGFPTAAFRPRPDGGAGEAGGLSEADDSESEFSKKLVWRRTRCGSFIFFGV